MPEIFFKKITADREQGDQKRNTNPIDPETTSFLNKINLDLENAKIDLQGKNYKLDSYGMPEQDSIFLFDSLLDIFGHDIEGRASNKDQTLRADKLINQYIGIYGHNRVARALIEEFKKYHVINKQVKDYLKEKIRFLVLNES